MQKKRRQLNALWRGLLAIFCLVAITLSIIGAFNLRLFGLSILPNTYLYLLLAFLFAPAFLLYPPKKGASGPALFYFDIFLFLLAFGSCMYLAIHGMEIMQRGWGFAAPLLPTILSVVIWFLLIEISRRTTGQFFAGIIALFSFYPIFASHMPGFLEGHQVTFAQTAIYHVMSNQSLLGIPLYMLGSLLIGYIIFGAVLMNTGGGDFFLKLAYALLGSTRGGPAKVAVLASGMFGSISGSALANVITTGSFTIPAMKRAGYPAHVAGAIEACASTGGMVMPPVMGATAFVMAGFLGLPYIYVAMFAAVPSALFYLGLLIQVDGFAAMHNIGGLSEEEKPSVWQTLVEGLPYLVSFMVMVWVMVYMFQEVWAPYFGIGTLLVSLMIRKSTRFTVRSFFHLIERILPPIAELSIMLAFVGFVIGSFALTGVGNSLSREIVGLAGGNAFIMILFGAIASFILGMGMTVTACYVFLVIVLAPALVQFGFYEPAVHLFILYWGILSAITPPVCLAALAAAPIAGASGMRIGLEAVRFGGIKYFVPFFFILNPALLLHGNVTDILISITLATLGVIFIAEALQGYLHFIGGLNFQRGVGYIVRTILVVAGCLLCIPYFRGRLIGLLALTGIVLTLIFWSRKYGNLRVKSSKQGLETI